VHHRSLEGEGLLGFTLKFLVKKLFRENMQTCSPEGAVRGKGGRYIGPYLLERLAQKAGVLAFQIGFVVVGGEQGVSSRQEECFGGGQCFRGAGVSQKLLGLGMFFQGGGWGRNR